MKRNLIYYLCLTAIGMMSFSSCQEEPEVTPAPEPELEVTEDLLEVPFEGGEYRIGYTISNPQEGVSLQFNETPDWITATTENGNTIVITVSPNESGEGRVADISGYYDECTFEIQVAQSRKPDFEIKVNDVTESTFSVTATPRDENLQYLFLYQELNEFNSYGGDEGYLEAALTYYNAVASKNGMTLNEYLDFILKKGESVNETENLVPGRTYIAGCVGYDYDNCCFSTGLNKIEINTVAVELDEMSFEYDVKVNGPVIDLNVVPSDTERYYYVGVAQNTDEIPPADEVVTQFQTQIYAKLKVITKYGYPVEEAVKMTAYHGEKDIDWELAENTKYYAFAVGVDMRGYINTTPVFAEINTTDVQPSDNVITVELLEVLKDHVTARTIVTNDDPYIVGGIAAEKFKGMTDEEILEELFSGKYNLPQSDRGPIEFELTRLKPGTEYLIFAFGYAAGKVTTDKIYKTEFTTPSDELGEASLELEYDKYFDGDELLEQYPEIFSDMEISGCAVLPIKAKPVGDVKEFYYMVMAGKGDVMSDDLVNKTLLKSGVTDDTYYAVIKYDKIHVIFGNAYDSKGRAGKVLRENITATKDGASPASEFTPFQEKTAAAKAINAPEDNGRDYMIRMKE